MGYGLFFIVVVVACLLWTATFIAAAARAERPWLRWLLAAVGWLVPPLGLVPVVALTAVLALINLETNWFAHTLTVLIAASVGGLGIAVAGLSRQPAGGSRVAAAWPVAGLIAMFVMAKAVAFGTLLLIDSGVAAQGRALRVEAARIMAAALPPAPAADDDAAPLYGRVFAAVEADTTLHEQQSPAANPLDADPGSAQVAAIVARHASTIDLLRRAADKPGCRFDRDWSRPAIDMPVPEMQSMRRAARLLALAARKAAAAGDGAAALADVVRMHRLGVHAASEPILVSSLVGQALDTLAIDVLADVLPRLEVEDLHLLDQAPVRDFLATPVTHQRAFRGEEAFGLATLADLADCRSGRSTLDGVRALSEAAPFESSADALLSLLYRVFLLPADVAGYRAILARYQAIAGSTAGPGGASFADVRTEADAIEESLRRGRAGIVTAIMTPALTGVVQAQLKGRARHAAAEVLVAVTRCRLTRGTLPAAVVPDVLPALPRDPFTADRPLLATRDGGELVVYSVGADGGDDGGPTARGDEPAAHRQANDDVGLRMAIGP
jgi:hypothetical protein